MRKTTCWSPSRCYRTRLPGLWPGQGGELRHLFCSDRYVGSQSNNFKLVVYHSLLLVFKINWDWKPGYLSEKLKKDFSYRTRQATGNCLVVQGTPDSDNTKTAFVHRTTIMWNNLPLNVRKIQVFLKFKHEVKNWVMRNIEIWGGMVWALLLKIKYFVLNVEVNKSNPIQSNLI